MVQEMTTDVTFKKAVCLVPHMVGTQNGEQAVQDWQTVAYCLEDMLQDDNQFVTLTVGDAPYGIRYVQATLCEEGVVVELGLEEGEHTRLVEKICTAEECLAIFERFYQTAAVQDVEQYQPVAFYV